MLVNTSIVHTNLTILLRLFIKLYIVYVLFYKLKLDNLLRSGKLSMTIIVSYDASRCITCASAYTTPNLCLEPQSSGYVCEE